MTDVRLRRYKHCMPPWATAASLKFMYKFAAQFGYTVHHIVPVSSDWVCGLHCRDNLTFLTADENRRRSNSTWPDMWGAQTDFFDVRETGLRPTTKLTCMIGKML